MEIKDNPEPDSGIKDSTEPDPAWAHAPAHRAVLANAVMVTASTYRKQLLFEEGPRLRLLHRALLEIVGSSNWRLEAWAVFANHYHFVALRSGESGGVRPVLQELHSRTAKALNQFDGIPERKVWHNYWESSVTFERSYIARLNYVHQNPVRHGLVAVANQYPYGSAAWFERTATPARVQTIYGFKTDRLCIPDDF